MSRNHSSLAAASLVLIALLMSAAGTSAQENRVRTDLTGGVPSSDALIEAFSIGVEPAPGREPATPRAETSVLLNVTFAINSARLDANGEALVRNLATALNSPNLIARRFTIEGHTDVSGPFDFNMRLSQDRATSVTNQLIALGVAPQRLTAVGFGPTRLLPSLGARDPRNRRVEVALSP